jgi:predicted nucleic acid-binding protein
LQTFILDSSAVLRFTDNEAGADRVAEILRACSASQIEARISALQWGEISGKLRKKHGVHRQEQVAQSLRQTGLGVISIDAQRAERAAAIRVDYKMGSADSYAAELALDSPESVLVTADYDFKLVQDLIRIEFLPAK